ncbi:extracellular calcium-sensing receptor-like [Ambystoma mexicanum]|uniref:extracellular calcium-sensing receptor-like n=1 Tax=Ambystoma mexicanum TaxID=8296 RepID=UPI0037E89CB4
MFEEVAPATEVSKEKGNETQKTQEEVSGTAKGECTTTTAEGDTTKIYPLMSRPAVEYSEPMYVPACPTPTPTTGAVATAPPPYDKGGLYGPTSAHPVNLAHITGELDSQLPHAQMEITRLRALCDRSQMLPGGGEVPPLSIADLTPTLSTAGEVAQAISEPARSVSSQGTHIPQGQEKEWRAVEFLFHLNDKPVRIIRPPTPDNERGEGCEGNNEQESEIEEVWSDLDEYEEADAERGSPLPNRRFQLQNYQSLQAMVFAVEEINKDPDLLPNISLGFRIYDSCRMMQRSLEGTLAILTGQIEPIPNFGCHPKNPLVGVIGDAGSSCSIVMARILGLYGLPQISFVSTSPLLSDRIHFPSFFRTIPNDDFQAKGLAHLLVYFGWIWVGLLAEDNDYGEQGAHILKQELEDAGACIAFTENIILSRADRNAFHIIQVIKKSTANVIVVFSSDAGLGPLVGEMVQHNVTGKIWIASEGWSISSPLAMDMYSEVLLGTIGFASYNGKVPGFEEHVNSLHYSRSAENGFLPLFWEEAFGCKWRDPKSKMGIWDNTSNWCTGEERLDTLHSDYNDVSDTRIAANVYNAVYAIAWAFHDFISARAVDEPFLNGALVPIPAFHLWQISLFLSLSHGDKGRTSEDFCTALGLVTKLALGKSSIPMLILQNAVVCLCAGDGAADEEVEEEEGAA